MVKEVKEGACAANTWAAMKKKRAGHVHAVSITNHTVSHRVNFSTKSKEKAT
jgi:hypothetical protein